MKLTLVLIIIAIIISPCFGQKSKSNTPKTTTLIESNLKAWSEYSTKEGRFSVSMPGKPTESSQTTTTPQGNVLFHNSYVRTLAEYQITYGDYSYDSVEGTDVTTGFFNTLRDGGVKGVKGQLIEDKEILLDGHQGHQYKVEFGGGYILISKMVFVKNRLYIISATIWGKNAPDVHTGRIQENAAKRFFESFKLMPAEINKEQPISH